jgi:hypothetical protein
MSKVVKVVVGAAMFVAGVLTLNPQFIIGGVSIIGSTLLAPKQKSANQERQASGTSLSLGEVSREGVVGETLVGGSLADAFNYGGKYGTDWEVLVIALADHECEALVGFYVNDAFVPFAGDGMVAGYNNQLQVYWRPGTEQQSVPAILTTYGPGWTASDNGAGVCHVTVAYKADEPEAKNPVWTAGRPRFAWLLRGAKCYDPRKDGTVPGGSGSHRLDDPSTWQWTDNPIVCRYKFVRGFYACDRLSDPAQLLIGRGLSAIEAPPENLFAPANVCDELVDGERRYRAAGIVQAAAPYIETEELFAAACAGIIIQPEGSVEIEPGQAKAPVAYITDADLLVGSKVDFSAFLSRAHEEWVNTVIPRYVEPTQRYADHAAPVRRDHADVLADRGPREGTLSLPFVKWAKQAGRIGEIARRLGRLWKRARITLGPRFCELEEGDWIVWTSQRLLKGASITFRVESYSLDEKWHNELQLREIGPSVYSEGAFYASTASNAQQGLPPPIGAPGAAAWALTPRQLASPTGGSVPVLAISGAVDDAYAQAVRFEYWRSDGAAPSASTPWIDAGSFGPGTKGREIGTVAPDAVYYAAVSYLVKSIPGERRVLGPVTTGKPIAGGVAPGGIDWNGNVIVNVPPALSVDANGFLNASKVARNGITVASLLTQLENADTILQGGLTQLEGSLNTLWGAFGTSDSLGFRARVINVENVTNGHATRISGVESTLNTPSTGLVARVGTVEQTVVDNNTAISNRATALESEITNARGGYLSLSAKIGTFSGTIADQLNSKASATVVTSIESEVVSARGEFGTLAARFGNVTGTIADALAGKATATSVTNLEASVGGLTSRVTTVENATATIEGRLEASWGVYVNAGGQIAGIRVYAASGQDYNTSSVDVLATVFRVSDGSQAFAPFTIVDGRVIIHGVLDVFSSTTGERVSLGSNLIQGLRNDGNWVWRLGVVPS